MIKQKALIGTELDTNTITIEAGLLKRIFRALHQPNPFTPLELTDFQPNNSTDRLPTFFLGSLLNLPKIYKILNINIKHVLLSRESLVDHQPIRVGDTIKTSTYLRDAYEQQATSNPIGFLVLATIGQKNEEIAFFNEKVLAIRGGFERRRLK